MDDQDICQNCRFWDPLWKFKKEQRFHAGQSDLERTNPRMTRGLRKDSNKGLCRRYAPQASALTTVWMETKSSDWCGDFQAGPEAP
ncbi:MAG: hypothetical protein OXR84_11855 [Magnetovibrio sp.]|nr:hypothetical protein [Magnetovibrio sp.]